MVKINKPWKLIDGKLYQYRCYRSDEFAAYNVVRDLKNWGYGTRREKYGDAKRIYNEEEHRYDIYVRPKVEEDY